MKFVERSNRVALKLANDPPTGEHSLATELRKLASTADHSSQITDYELRVLNSGVRPALRRLLQGAEKAAPAGWFRSLANTSTGRRSFLASGLGLLAGVLGGAGSALATKAFGARLEDPTRPRPVRPPGSVPEPTFLELCIRCGECFKVCPNSVLQPLGFQQGLEGLWSPQVVADWAGCEPSCNACGQACPTGAIRAIPLEEKRGARMGLAVVNEKTCLPWVASEACQLCVDECTAAGYEAIEFIRVHAKADESGKPILGTGFLAPKVLADKCVGCGLCQMRCYSINAKTKKLLPHSAIIIEAGDGKEDRLMNGSYLELRKQERLGKTPAHNGSNSIPPETYLPEFLQSPQSMPALRRTP
ncbi:MAG: 4Fe-4S dicluster domain-containing protein [Verrucomicrobia bacterium]|nr:4Fe-4S dicluster domain-containing protein [Verrucomicrobiota bacterium]